MKNKKLITIITASIAGVILLAIALPLAFGSRSAKRETARPVSDDTSSQARYVNSEAAMDMGGDYYTAETTLPDYYLDYDYEDDSAYYAAEYVEGANGGFNNTTSLYDPAAPAAAELALAALKFSGLLSLVPVMASVNLIVTIPPFFPSPPETGMVIV